MGTGVRQEGAGQRQVLVFTYKLEEANKTYSKKFIDNMITEHSLPPLTREDLRGIGVTVIGHVTAILAAGKASGSASLSSVSATLAWDQVNSQRNKLPSTNITEFALEHDICATEEIPCRLG